MCQIYFQYFLYYINGIYVGFNKIETIEKVRTAMK